MCHRADLSLLTFALALALASAAECQNAISLAGAGYADPSRIMVAPGQVITFFINGVQTVLPPEARVQRATSLPLPTTLAGLSATVTQGGVSRQLPLFSVQQIATCSDQTAVTADCVITALTLQMPVDLLVPNPTQENPFLRTTTITMSENGSPSKAFLVSPVIEHTHILTACDLIVPNQSGACFPIVAHLDGTLVSSESPAKPGEILTLYALGMGATSPPVPEGTPTPASAPVAANQFGLVLDYLNPLGMVPSGGPLAPAPVNPLFVGLTPGQVGLYQVNFMVQAPAFAAPSCGVGGSPNLTIMLQRGATGVKSDSGQICVNAGGTTVAPASSSATTSNSIPLGSFTPATLWLPIGSDLTSLGAPVPPQSVGIPGPSAAVSLPPGNFAPQTLWFPIGSDLTYLGQPVPPQSVGLPGPNAGPPSTKP